MLIETTENDGLTLSPTLSSCFVCMSPCLRAPLNLLPYGAIQIRLLLLLLFYSGTQFPGKEKNTLCNYKKYKNQPGMNLTPPPPSQLLLCIFFFNFYPRYSIDPRG